MTNFGLADSFLRFIESQNDFKEVVTRFQKYVYFPRYSGVRTLKLRDSQFFSIFVSGFDLHPYFAEWDLKSPY